MEEADSLIFWSFLSFDEGARRISPLNRPTWDDHWRAQEYKQPLKNHPRGLGPSKKSNIETWKQTPSLIESQRGASFFKAIPCFNAQSDTAGSSL